MKFKLVSLKGDRKTTTDKVTSPRGNAEAILLVMREPPHLTAADVDELDASIATGRVSPSPVKLETD